MTKLKTRPPHHVQNKAAGMSDPLWPVVKPRNGDESAVEEMNAKMMIWHPGLEQTRRETHKVMHDARDVIQKDCSVSELFRRIIEQPQ